MRYAQSVVPTAAPASLSDLMINVTRPEDGYMELTLKAGASTVNIGNNAAQPYALLTGETIQFRLPGNLRNVWVSGAGTLVVLVSQ